MTSSEFQQVAANDLKQILYEMLALETDRRAYWRVQEEVIHKNIRLVTASNPFLEMIYDAYAHATASRIRRLVDPGSRTVSLRRIVEGLRRHPELYAAKISAEELEDGIAKLNRTSEKVTDYVDQFVAHHDRNPRAAAPTHREMNEAIDNLIQIFKKCYSVIENTDVDVEVRFNEDLLSIFRFPWIPPLGDGSAQV